METAAETAPATPPAPPADQPSKEDQRLKAINDGRIVLVVDTTATDPNRPRIHEYIEGGQVKRLSFKPNEAKELPRLLAATFLKHEGFIRVNAEGDQIEWDGAVPKQPSEMGAGEKFVLKANETIARFSELTAQAIANRAALIPGGPEFIQRPGLSKQEVIDFVQRYHEEEARKNTKAEEDVLVGDGIEGGFIPDASDVTDPSDNSWMT